MEVRSRSKLIELCKITHLYILNFTDDGLMVDGREILHQLIDGLSHY